MDSLLHDLRYAARQVARTPALTLVVAAVLAIGIGANTALLTVLDALLLRPPAGVRDAEGLVHVGMIRATATGSQFPLRDVSYPEFLEFQRQRDVFATMAVERAALVAVRDEERGAAPRRAVLVSSEYFAVLRPRLVLGTAFAPADDAHPQPVAQAVVSHAFWTRELGAREDVVGRSLDVNGVRVTVIGVAADRFIGVAVPEEGTDLWLPLSLHALLFPEAAGLLAAPDSTAFSAFARLARGLPLEAASAAAATIADRLEATLPPGDARYRQLDARVVPLRAFPAEAAGRILGTIGLGGGLLSGLLLLIACANAGGLLLARAVMRRQEVGVKLALGASRGRVVRQLLAESLLLALLAGALASLLLVWFRSTLQGVFSFVIDLSPRPAVFLATAVLTAVTGIAFGVLPALHATRASVSETLKTGGAGLDPHRSRLLQGFVVAQLALGLPLLLAAALFGAATRAMESADLGFTAGRDALGVELDFRVAGYSVEQADALIDGLRARASSLPGVRSVAFASGVPMFRSYSSVALRLPPEELARAGVRAGFTRVAGVDPEYFATVGIPILRGRGLGAADVPGAPLVAVVDENFARTAWPGLDPIGRTLHTTLDTTRTVEVTVVGVARAVQRSPLAGSDYRVAYMARRQLTARPGGVLVVRAGQDATGLAPALRALIVDLDPRLPIAGMHGFEQAMRASLREYLPAVTIARAAAVLALVLGCLGVYALIAFSVAQRAREVAIRMALGARAADVTALFLRQGTKLALYGLVLGLPLGMAIRLALTTLLGDVGITAGTAAALGGVVVILLLAAAAGSWLPARRAARVEPFRLLRTE